MSTRKNMSLESLHRAAAWRNGVLVAAILIGGIDLAIRYEQAGFKVLANLLQDPFWSMTRTTIIYACYAWAFWLVWAHDRKGRQLRDRILAGHIICPKCEYDLKPFLEVADIRKCPECNRSLPRIARLQRRWRAWARWASTEYTQSRLVSGLCLLPIIIIFISYVFSV